MGCLHAHANQLQQARGISLRLRCWHVAPRQPGWHAVHWVALVQAVQCPEPMELQFAQPAVEQYCPGLHDVAVQVPATQVSEMKYVRM